MSISHVPRVLPSWAKRRARVELLRRALASPSESRIREPAVGDGDTAAPREGNVAMFAWVTFSLRSEQPCACIEVFIEKLFVV